MQFWLDLLKIIGIDIMLSGDNAVVIAMASRSLRPSHRRLAIIGGSAAAVTLRIVMALVVASLLAVPYLKLIGGLLLLHIGIKLVVAEETDENDIEARAHLWGAIRTILVADAVMSLDNVVAIAAAAHGNPVLIALGLVISIPLIIFGSQLLVGVLGRFPMLAVLGGGLLGWIAAEIMASDPVLLSHVPYDEHTLDTYGRPILAAAVIAIGLMLAKRQPGSTPQPD